MRISEGPRVVTKCDDCELRLRDSFCAMPEPAAARLRSIKGMGFYPRGSTIFMEGQTPAGVYLLCSGRAKLSAGSEDGKTIILRIAEAGEVLGMNAVFGNSLYEKTAQALVDCTVGFIKRNDFISFVKTYHEAALIALRQLSSNYHKAHLQICSLGLSASASDKLAKLLLQWCESSPQGAPVKILRGYTHSEIAEMIGASRETVTRLLGSFRERGLIQFSKGGLVIEDRERLRTAIGTRFQNGNGHL